MPNPLFGNHSNEVEIDRSNFKIFSLAFVGAISFFLFGWLLKIFFRDWNYDFLWISGAAVFVSLIIFVFQALFIKDFRRLATIVLIESFLPALAFYDLFSKAILASLFVVFLFILWGSRAGVSLSRNSLNVNFFGVSRAVLAKAIAASALFASVVFFNSIVNFSNGDFFLSQAAFEKMLEPAAPFIKRFVPEFEISLSLNELSLILAEGQINSSSQAKILPKSVKTQLAEQSAKEIQKSFSEILGMKLNPKIKISESIYLALKDKFFSLPENIRYLILLGVAAALFLTIETFVFPLRLIVSFMAFIIYQILLAAGFAETALEGKNKEIIILK